MKDMILSRAQQVVERQELEAKLDGTPMRVKFGIDPTGARLHLGRASTIHRLKNLQDMGHTIVLIIGDRTAEIGDASDKMAERAVLSAQQISANLMDYERQLGLILDMSKVELRRNSEWFDKLDAVEFARLAQHFTVAQMLERENFALRYQEQKPISLHEFLYPMLQGYDSVAVRADLEVGGTDQLFNLMAGRVMQKHYGQRPQSVMTFDLLTGPDGRKMSTSWGNAIYITDEPADMFGKLMRVNDEFIAQYYRIATDVPVDVINTVVQDIAAGANPRDTKASLAREIVTMYHGESAALAAEEAFNHQFRDGNRPADIETKTISKNAWDPVELLVGLELATSNSDARRLLEQGGVRLNDEKIAGTELRIKTGDIIQVGKRRFARLKIG